MQAERDALNEQVRGPNFTAVQHAQIEQHKCACSNIVH